MSATHWLTRISAAWLVAVAAGLVVVSPVGFQVWFSLQLLAQDGRLLERLGKLEALVGELAPRRQAAPQIGVGLTGGGPLGSSAPDFELVSTDGSTVSLGSLLGGRRPLVLVFSDSGCGPCNALLPEVAGWQSALSERLMVVLIASGDPQANRTKAAEHGTNNMLLQPGTPSPMLTRRMGRLQPS